MSTVGDDPREWGYGGYAFVGVFSSLLAMGWGLDDDEDDNAIGEWFSPGHKLTIGTSIVQYATLLHLILYREYVAAFSTAFWSVIGAIPEWYFTMAVVLFGGVPFIASGLWWTYQ